MICKSFLYKSLRQITILSNVLKITSTNFIVHYQTFNRSWELTLNMPIATKVVCYSRLLECLRSLYGKQCGPRSDCSYRSSLFWVHTACFYTLFVSNVRQLFAADDFSRRHFQMHFFLGALRVFKSSFLQFFRSRVQWFCW